MGLHILQLPDELLELIARQLDCHPPRSRQVSLLGMARSCRRLHAIVQPLLWIVVRLNCHSHDQSMVVLARAAARVPAHALLTKHLQLSGILQDATSHRSPNTLRSSTSRDLRGHLGPRLPLQGFIGPDTHHTHRHSQPLQSPNFSLREELGPNFLAQFANLISLALSSEALIAVPPYRGGELPHLEEILVYSYPDGSWSGTSWNYLCPFWRLPNLQVFHLRFLGIMYTSIMGNGPDDLAPARRVVLRNCTVSADMLIAMTDCRGIISLEITGTSISRTTERFDQVDYGNSGMAPHLTDLYLTNPSGWGPYAAFCRVPSIKTLHFDMDSFHQAITTLSEGSHLPALETLCFEIKDSLVRFYEVQHQIVAIITASPSLRRLELRLVSMKHRQQRLEEQLYPIELRDLCERYGVVLLFTKQERTPPWLTDREPFYQPLTSSAASYLRLPVSERAYVARE